jgi:hypothetical protein
MLRCKGVLGGYPYLRGSLREPYRGTKGTILMSTKGNT